MAIYINLVCSKGGVGKTTVAAILSSMFRAYGKTVALVDHDPAANLLGWWDLLAHHGERPPYTVVIGDRSNPEKQLAALGPDHDAVILDCAGAEDPIFDQLATLVDLSLVPFTLGQQDLRKLLQMRSAFERLANTIGQPLSWLAVLNRVTQIDKTHPAFLQLPAFAAKQRIPLATTMLWQRRAFQNLTGDATAIDYAKKSDEAALQNADALFREIVARIRDDRRTPHDAATPTHP